MCTTQQVILITYIKQKTKQKLQGSRLLKHVFALLARFTIAVHYNGFKSRNFCKYFAGPETGSKSNLHNKEQSLVQLEQSRVPEVDKEYQNLHPECFSDTIFHGQHLQLIRNKMITSITKEMPTTASKLKSMVNNIQRVGNGKMAPLPKWPVTSDLT